MTLYGFKLIDLAAIAGYFIAVLLIGIWASRRVKSEGDFFLGGRRFGKGLLLMHWVCTGTHTEHAVQISGAVARIGLGGIWYQWLYLFSTPFYWLLAPVFRRLRVTTTGDFFRIRYGRSCEMLYSAVALGYIMLSIALLLRGAAAAISGATGGILLTQHSVILLAIMFSSIVVAGGLVAAAYTDVLQGILIIMLSVMLIPGGLAAVGGLEGLHRKLGASMFSVTAPAGSQEGDLWFVIAMSLLGLVGVGAQPHVMTANAAGKREMEARLGMCYGNFVKRLLTVAWAFTGLLAAAHFSDVLSNVKGHAAAAASETLYGRAIQAFLGDGWRGLMTACLIAGVTSSETFIVTGSALFTRNLYGHLFQRRDSGHQLRVARIASAGLLACGVALAIAAASLTQILLVSFQLVGLLGGAFWLGVTWRRANTAGVWASVLGGALSWAAFQTLYPGISQARQVSIILAVELGLLVLVSLLTRPPDPIVLNSFYARLLTPVGRESEVASSFPGGSEAATLGLEGVTLDYKKASSLFGWPLLQRLGIEIPRMTPIDWGGFAAAWLAVFALLGLLLGVARA